MLNFFIHMMFWRLLMSQKYIKLKENDLEKLHKEIFVILEEIHRICEENNINYFLSDGTLLGAIRHKGFIPWDDDADVQMLRTDYNRFCEICEKELKEDFFLQTQETDENYNWIYGKVRLKNTEYIRSGQEHLKQSTGIFVDIFPLDNASENKIIRDTINLICLTLRKILWAQVGMKSEKSRFKRFFYKLLNKIPRKITISTFNFFTKYFNDTNTKYLTCNSGGYYKNRTFIVDRNWYKSSIKVEFEGKRFNVPIKYKEVLKKSYGDYMKLPPKYKQIGPCYASYIKFSDGSELKI